MKKASIPAKPQGTPRSWRKTWLFMTLTFAAVVFAALASNQDDALAQETPPSKAKATKQAVKALPVAASLTHGKKVDAVALAKLIEEHVLWRPKSGSPFQGAAPNEFVKVEK